MTKKKWKRCLHPKTEHAQVPTEPELMFSTALLPGQMLCGRKADFRSYNNLKFCWTILGNRPDQKREYSCQTQDNVYRAENVQYLLLWASIQWWMKCWASGEGEDLGWVQFHTVSKLSYTLLSDPAAFACSALSFCEFLLHNDYFVCSSSDYLLLIGRWSKRKL